MTRTEFRIQVHYPVASGALMLRTDFDWQRDVKPVTMEHSTHQFIVETEKPFVYFKPVLVGGSGARWSVGENYLALGSSRITRHVYPNFDAHGKGSVSELRESGSGADRHAYRVFYPPSYQENTLRRYPVLYMHDGQNLFVPDQSPHKQHWAIAETLERLDAMNLVERMLVVGVYPNHREDEYTKPGYERYGRFIVETLKPQIDREHRTLRDAARTAVMGSSLGGVVSLYLAWEWPDVFGMAACLSSTFGWRDDLKERVLFEPPRARRVYLDSGWPGDNYEVTREMHSLFLRKGYQPGHELLYLGFPHAGHDEVHWAKRFHIPLQFLFENRPPAHVDAA